jgi:hypothetical protein
LLYKVEIFKLFSEGGRKALTERQKEGKGKEGEKKRENEKEGSAAGSSTSPHLGD